MSNAEKIRVLLAEGVSAKDIAKKCKTSLAYVYVVKSKWKLEKMAEPEPVPQVPDESDWHVKIQSDMVNQPPHYQGNPGVPGAEVECIDAIRSQLTEEEFRGYCKGSVSKYLWRMNLKGDPIENAEKAAWYLAWLRGEDPRAG